MAPRGRVPCIGGRDARVGLRLSGTVERLNWRGGVRLWRPRGSEKPMPRLEFRWCLPTHGETTAYGWPEAQVPASPEFCGRVVAAANSRGRLAA